MAKVKLSNANAVKEFEQIWLNSPHGSPEEKEALRRADEIIRAKLKSADTPEECWGLYLEAIHESDSGKEAWQKYNELDKARKQKRGES